MASTKLFLMAVILTCLFSANYLKAYNSPDHMKVIVPEHHVSYNEALGGPIASFVYRESDKRFYVNTYGSNKGIRCFVEPDGSFPEWDSMQWPVLNKKNDNYGKSWQCTTESTMSRVAESLDMPAGLYNSNFPSELYMHGMILNPSPVTVNGTYFDSGSLAIIIDCGMALASTASKRLITWDLREVWSPADVNVTYDPNSFDLNEFDPSSPHYDSNNLPDRANAEYDTGWLMTDVFGSQYGYGCTNWNDAFNYVLTLQDMANAIGVGFVYPTKSDNTGRNGIFSTDGKKVYFVSMDVRSSYLSRTFTGLWSTNIETGETKRLFDDTGIDEVNETVSKVVTCSEPGVLSVGLRNLTDQPYNPNFDQVLFNATEVSGNLAGLNCLVDDGSDTPPIHHVITGEDMLEFLEIDIYDPSFYGIEPNIPSTWPDGYDPNNPDPAVYVDVSDWPRIWSISTDDEGNIYFYARVSYALFKYDLQNRLIAVKNRPQHILFNKSLNSTSGNTGNLRLKMRTIEAPYDPNETIQQAMYVSTAGKCVAGIDIYKPCDFNRDGEITHKDLDFFAYQFHKYDDSNSLPEFNDNDILNYLKADLNASARLNDDKTGLINVPVTEKDVDILHRFVIPGNVNLDDKVDIQDFAILASYYDADDPNGWGNGDFNFDGNVDNADFQYLVNNWLEYDD